MYVHVVEVAARERRFLHLGEYDLLTIKILKRLLLKKPSKYVIVLQKKMTIQTFRIRWLTAATACRMLYTRPDRILRVILFVYVEILSKINKTKTPKTYC